MQNLKTRLDIQYMKIFLYIYIFIYYSSLARVPTHEIQSFGTSYTTSYPTDVAGHLHCPMKKIIDQFIQRGSAEITARLLKECRRKLFTFEKRLFEAIKTINKHPDWTVAQSDKTNRWIPIEVAYYREKMMERLNKNYVKINVTYLERVEAIGMVLYIMTINPLWTQENKATSKAG